MKYLIIFRNKSLTIGLMTARDWISFITSIKELKNTRGYILHKNEIDELIAQIRNTQFGIAVPQALLDFVSSPIVVMRRVIPFRKPFTHDYVILQERIGAKWANTTEKAIDDYDKIANKYINNATLGNGITTINYIPI